MRAGEHEQFRNSEIIISKLFPEFVGVWHVILIVRWMMGYKIYWIGFGELLRIKLVAR